MLSEQVFVALLEAELVDLSHEGNPCCVYLFLGGVIVIGNIFCLSQCCLEAILYALNGVVEFVGAEEDVYKRPVI